METISIESDSELVMNNCTVLESYAEISHAPSLPSLYLPKRVELNVFSCFLPKLVLEYSVNILLSNLISIHKKFLLLQIHINVEK